jgi:hypothetical protein
MPAVITMICSSAGMYFLQDNFQPTTDHSLALAFANLALCLSVLVLVEGFKFSRWWLWVPGLFSIFTPIQILFALIWAQ